MKNDEIDSLLAGADAQLSRAIEGLITLDARHADYALALDQAAMHLLRLKNTGLVNSSERFHCRQPAEAFFESRNCRPVARFGCIALFRPRWLALERGTRLYVGGLA